ncbi:MULTISPECIES: PepSY domain-containing protein [Bartonella]|uniref:Peptidase propeptide and YPEB domain-containing protein n=1 Tax=Bartonella choladocola TaxID=2750995 RepID=A0A1U9MF36_9HYPH|nr:MULTISPECIES: PepSY domain-containing protein [Bartonella]AQT46348.1 Peptidase propeptide and YPEB domain-containing protein [Bartonella choladocola]MBH9974647.1 PepSY domain-containing protein [Bartonella choladocola]MBI0014254.1 PepSY domain-containing protein [Bartonella sp. B10834G3]MBI0139714.1 PepSY domain-containing protein [Bartonella choladocola]
MILKTVRMIALAAATATIALSGFASSAFAEQNARISWSALTTKLEQSGYKIHELDEKHEGWKAEVIDKNNQRLKLYIDRQGNITRQKIDH